MAVTYSGTASGQAWTGRAVFVGVSLTSTQDASRIDIYDGTDATGRLIASLAVPANTTSTSKDNCPPVYCNTGVYVDVVSGTTPQWIVYIG